MLLILNSPALLHKPTLLPPWIAFPIIALRRRSLPVYDTQSASISTRLQHGHKHGSNKAKKRRRCFEIFETFCDHVSTSAILFEISV